MHMSAIKPYGLYALGSSPVIIVDTEMRRWRHDTLQGRDELSLLDRYKPSRATPPFVGLLALKTSRMDDEGADPAVLLDNLVIPGIPTDPIEAVKAARAFQQQLNRRKDLNLYLTAISHKLITQTWEQYIADRR